MVAVMAKVEGTALMELRLRPIGRVENTYCHPARPGEIRQMESRLVIAEEFAPGLDGIEEHQWLTVVFHFHLSQGYELRQHPQGDTRRPRRGVFALCSPRRPNPLGVSFVRLLHREGNILVVKGLDALNGSPILDIKPFVPPAELERRGER